MGRHYIDILRQCDNGLGNGAILGTLGIAIMAVLTLVLVATTSVTTLSTKAISVGFGISCGVALADAGLLG